MSTLLTISMNRILTLLLLALLLGSFAQAEEIAVAAAADLTYVMKDLATQFKSKTGSSVTLSFGASGSFYAQVAKWSSVRLFFSADSEYLEKLAAAGKIDSVIHS